MCFHNDRFRDNFENNIVLLLEQIFRIFRFVCVHNLEEKFRKRMRPNSRKLRSPLQVASNIEEQLYNGLAFCPHKFRALLRVQMALPVAIVSGKFPIGSPGWPCQSVT
jgi:hypothetical protein